MVLLSALCVIFFFVVFDVGIEGFECVEVVVVLLFLWGCYVGLFVVCA